MKRRHTQAGKARRLNLHFCYQGGVTAMSVFERRVRGIYGADHLQHDAKYPGLEGAVEGMRQRIAQAQAQAKSR